MIPLLILASLQVISRVRAALFDCKPIALARQSGPWPRSRNAASVKVMRLRPRRWQHAGDSWPVLLARWPCNHGTCSLYRIGAEAYHCVGCPDGPNDKLQRMRLSSRDWKGQPGARLLSRRVQHCSELPLFALLATVGHCRPLIFNRWLDLEVRQSGNRLAWDLDFECWWDRDEFLLRRAG